jgi:hypothetical protein
VVPLTPALADRVAANLARAHAREIRELSGLSPATALRLSLASSVLAHAVTDDAGEPLCALGVETAGFLTRTAQVWMIGTAEMPAHARKVLRCVHWGLSAAFRATGARRLEQYIPAWYETGLRFAKRLGFVPGPASFDAEESRAVHVILTRISLAPPNVRGL